MKILHTIGSFIASLLISIGVIATPAPVQPIPVPSQNLGAAITQGGALYDGFLASGITPTSNSMTLTTGAFNDGTSLSGWNCFTVDANSPSIEYICGNASGTSVSNLMRGVGLVNPNTSSSVLAFTHSRGASVQITDYPDLQILKRILNGTDAVPNQLFYSAHPTSTASTTIEDKSYIDNQVVSGAPNGSPTVKGIYQEATTSTIASGTIIGTTGADLTLTQNTASTSCPAYSVAETNASGTLGNCFTNGTNLTPGSLTSPSTTLNGTTTINSALFTIAPSGVTNIWGNGIDGSSTFNTSTTLSRDIYYTNLTVATGVVLETANYKIFVNGVLTVNGTIDNSGANGGSASLTTPGTGASAIATGTLPSNIGGHVGGPANGTAGNFNSGGSGGGQGGAGGGSGASGGIVSIFARNIVIGSLGIIQSNGGLGGNGGNGAPDSPGSGSGGCISGGSAPSAPSTTAVLYSIGVNTLATTTANGGTGGSGCGAQGSQAPSLGNFSTSTYLPNNIFTAFSNFNAIAGVPNNTSAQTPGGAGGGIGGNVITGSGGAGGGGGGGYGGNGGVIILVYSNLTNGGAINVNGGSPGSGGTAGSQGSGSAGTNGTSGATGILGTIYQIKV